MGESDRHLSAVGGVAVVTSRCEEFLHTCKSLRKVAVVTNGFELAVDDGRLQSEPFLESRLGQAVDPPHRIVGLGYLSR